MSYLFDDVYDDSFDFGMESYTDDTDNYAYENESNSYVAAIASRTVNSFLGQIASESFNEGYNDAMIAMEGASVESIKRLFEQLKSISSEAGSVSASDKKRVEAFINKYEGQMGYITSVIQGGKDSLRNIRIAILVEYCVDLLILVLTGPFIAMISSAIFAVAIIVQCIVYYVKLNHTTKAVNEAKKFSNELKRIAASKNCDSKNADKLLSMATKLDGVTDLSDER